MPFEFGICIKTSHLSCSAIKHRLELGRVRNAGACDCQDSPIGCKPYFHLAIWTNKRIGEGALVIIDDASSIKSDRVIHQGQLRRLNSKQCFPFVEKSPERFSCLLFRHLVARANLGQVQRPIEIGGEILNCGGDWLKRHLNLRADSLLSCELLPDCIRRVDSGGRLTEQSWIDRLVPTRSAGIHRLNSSTSSRQNQQSSCENY